MASFPRLALLQPLQTTIWQTECGIPPLTAPNNAHKNNKLVNKTINKLSHTYTRCLTHTHTLHNAGYSIWHERLNAKLHNFAQFLFIFQLLRSPFGRENWIQKSIFFTFHCQQQQPHTGVLGWYFIFHSDPFVDAYSIDDGFIFTLVCFLPPNTRTGKTEWSFKMLQHYFNHRSVS